MQGTRAHTGTRTGTLTGTRVEEPPDSGVQRRACCVSASALAIGPWRPERRLVTQEGDSFPVVVQVRDLAEFVSIRTLDTDPQVAPGDLAAGAGSCGV